MNVRDSVGDGVTETDGEDVIDLVNDRVAEAARVTDAVREPEPPVADCSFDRDGDTDCVMDEDTDCDKETSWVAVEDVEGYFDDDVDLDPLRVSDALRQRHP